MKSILTSIALLLCFNISFAAAPTVQASNVQITFKTTTGASISWTRGNGQYCIVVVRNNASGNVAPPSSTSAIYNANITYGGGTSLGNFDNFVMYDNSGTSVFIGGLNPNVIYEAYVYEYNQTGLTYYYNNTITSGNSEYFNTMQIEPTTAASISSVSSISYTSSTINMAVGNGGGRQVFLRPTSGANASPSDGVYYAASSLYGSGAALGGGYIMYSSTGSSVAVTGLTPATLYYAYPNEYNDGTYPTSSLYNYNSRNYKIGSGYGFYTLNNVPTLSAISNTSVCQNSTVQSVNLSGITDGSTSESQTTSISATSSNQTLIPNANISITYTSPNSTGVLYYTPANGQSGTAIISVVVNDGWFSNNTVIVNFTVTVNAIPGAAGVITGASPICAGGVNQVFSIPACSNATSYTWTFPSNWGIASGANTNVITFSTTPTSSSGNISVYATNANGCGNGTSSLKSIQVDAQPSAALAGPDQNILCSGTAFLNATAVNLPNVGTWAWLSGLPAPSIGSATQASTSVTGMADLTTFKYTWSVSNGGVCPAKKDTVALTTNFNSGTCNPQANFTSNPVGQACVNTNMQFLDASISANTWAWDFDYNGSVFNSMSTLQNPTYTYGTTGPKTVRLKIHSNATGLDYFFNSVINIITVPAAPLLISGPASGMCAGSINQVLYSISAVPTAQSYNWFVPSGSYIDAYPSSTSIAVIYTNLAVDGPISVSATNICGTSATSTLSINVNEMPTIPLSISGPTTVCQGQTAVTYTVNGANFATGYYWTDISGNYSSTPTNTVSFNISNLAISNRIYVKGFNSCGSGDSIGVAIVVDPLPDNASPISGSFTLSHCPIPSNITYSVTAINNATGYTWSASNGAIITSGSNSNIITLDLTNVSSSSSLTVYGTNACGSGVSSQITINLNPLPTAEICVVSVDTGSVHNEIFFEKNGITGVEKFRIYRKLSVTSDTLVGEVLFSAPGYLLDTLGIDDPNASPSDYTITAFDSCGHESAKGAYHRTMFMQANQGIGVMNLSWNDYIGQTTNFFRVLRDSMSNGSWEILSSTLSPIGNNVYTDNSPPLVITNLRYRIETDWLLTCDPTRGVINTTRSNIKAAAHFAGISQINEVEIKVFPNPAVSLVNLEFPSGLKPTVQVYNVIGENVYGQKFNANKAVIDVSNWVKGIYSVVIQDGENKVVKKLVIQ